MRRAVALTLLATIAVAAGMTIVGWHVLHVRKFQPEPQLTTSDLYALLKVSFGVAAGIGGVVALVTAYRRQQLAEIAETREREQAGVTELRESTRLLNERFATAAAQLGNDSPAVRLAGVYAMAGLADDWPEQRQICVDVLCAVLRMPHTRDPGDAAPLEEQLAYGAAREVRAAIVAVITAHLQRDERRAASVRDWRGLRLDFTGAVIDSGYFNGAEFTGDTLFHDVEFTGPAGFASVKFAGNVYFVRTRFGAQAVFACARFAQGKVMFIDTEFCGEGGRFSRPSADFWRATVEGGMVEFRSVNLEGKRLLFNLATLSGGRIVFEATSISAGALSFSGTKFTGTEVDFRRARFRSTPDFEHAGRMLVPPLLPRGEDPPQGIAQILSDRLNGPGRAGERPIQS